GGADRLGRCHRAGGEKRRRAPGGARGPQGADAVLPARCRVLGGRTAGPAGAAPPRTGEAGPAAHRFRVGRGGRCPGSGGARVARGCGTWGEGGHDAELVDKVWGDGLRIEGVVVEVLEGMDNVADRLTQFAAGPGRRVGVLADHLVPGSKESRIAQAATSAF